METGFLDSDLVHDAPTRQEIQLGLRRRTWSHVDFCSWPGLSTASNVS